jgi:hypothetical protein
MTSDDFEQAWMENKSGFASNYFWGSLVGKLCTTSNFKITMEVFLLSVTINFANKKG